MKVLLVGLGGFAGSILRYWLGGLVQGLAPGSSFPIGTLAVNVLGCFAIGVLSELVEVHGALSPGARALLMAGLLGGFTTFSAFANESVSALRAGAPGIAVANVLLSVAACLVAVQAGRRIAALAVG